MLKKLFEIIKEKKEQKKEIEEIKRNAKKEYYASDDYKESIKQAELAKIKEKKSFRQFAKEFDFKGKFERMSGSDEQSRADKLKKIMNNK